MPPYSSLSAGAPPPGARTSSQVHACVCVCVCHACIYAMHVRALVPLCVHAHVPALRRMHMYMCELSGACTCTCASSQVHAHVRAQPVHARVRACTCLCTHTRMAHAHAWHMHTHVYMHMHVCMHLRARTCTCMCAESALPPFMKRAELENLRSCSHVYSIARKQEPAPAHAHQQVMSRQRTVGVPAAAHTPK